MAAILCDGIDNICNGACKLISLPCKLCGAGCNKISNLLCGNTVSLSNLLCRNPLSLYLGIVLVAQIPPIIISLTIIPDLFNNDVSYTGNDYEARMIGGCQSGSYWLLLGIVFSIIHIVAVFYVALRVTNADDAAVQHLQSSYKRICYFLCRDPWIAFYILILLAYFIWLCLGMNRELVLGYYSNNNVKACPKWSIKYYDNIHSKILDVIGFSWFFLVGGSVSFLLSLCCTCCDYTNYSSGSNNSPEIPATPPTNTMANNGHVPDVETPPLSSSYAYHEQQAEEPSTYSTRGIPIHTGLQQDIPVAVAEAIPLPSTKIATAQHYTTAGAAKKKTCPNPSAPPSAFDNTSDERNIDIEYNVAATAYKATLEEDMKPSAPPAAFDTTGNEKNLDKEYEATAAAFRETMEEEEDKKPSAVANAGSAIGKGLGKLLFNSNESRQQQLEKHGKSAGKAVGKGFSMAKEFLGSKLKKDDNKN